MKIIFTMLYLPLTEKLSIGRHCVTKWVLCFRLGHAAPNFSLHDCIVARIDHNKQSEAVSSFNCQFCVCAVS